jgi:cytochrome P450 monooxygenase
MDFLFGKSLGFLNPVVPAEATEFIEAFKKAQIFITTRRDSGWLDFRLARFKSANKNFEKSYTIVHKFVDKQVARALRENKLNDVKDGADDPPVKRRYILLDEMVKHMRGPIQLRYHVLGPFFPGRDTTAIAVSNVLFQLARHTHYWAQLRKKALEVQEPLTFEKLKSLVLFKYVLQETIRTIGPVARVWRVALKDTILPVGGGLDQKSPLLYLEEHQLWPEHGP